MHLFSLMLGALLLQQPSTAPSSAALQGTAELKGRVVDALSGQPIGGVVVRLSIARTPPAPPRSVTSDEAGRFAFTLLPAGQYTVSVTRAGVVTTSFGAAEPRRVTPVIADGA